MRARACVSAWLSVDTAERTGRTGRHALTNTMEGTLRGQTSTTHGPRQLRAWFQKRPRHIGRAKRKYCVFDLETDHIFMYDNEAMTKKKVSSRLVWRNRMSSPVCC